MTDGKIIVIEGTDCSGKETQSKMLIDRLNEEGENTEYFSFPNYASSTGKIVGLSYLGKGYLADELIDSHESIVEENMKPYIRNSRDRFIMLCTLETVKKALQHGWFPETAPNVDALVSSLYYAADRRYNMPYIKSIIASGKNCILDRYVYSNMAHQGGKIADSAGRYELYKNIANLEFNTLGLPTPDERIFLHMPTEYAELLKSGRAEAADENEKDINHLKNAEKAYMEIANLFDFHVIECVKNISNQPKLEDIKTKEEINDEIYEYIKSKKVVKKH